MKIRNIAFATILLATLGCIALSPAAQAAPKPKPSPTPQTWYATVGAQSDDQGEQALAFRYVQMVQMGVICPTLSRLMAQHA